MEIPIRGRKVLARGYSNNLTYICANAWDALYINSPLPNFVAKYGGTVRVKLDPLKVVPQDNSNWSPELNIMGQSLQD